MRQVVLLAMIAALVGTSAIAKPASHHASSAPSQKTQIHPGVPNKHWVPGYGDDRTCHGACLTAPIWGKLFGFFGNFPNYIEAAQAPQHSPKHVHVTSGARSSSACSATPKLCQ
jgi:hypothetical protein